MGKKERDKGTRGELDAATKLAEYLNLPHKPERILDQCRGEGNGIDLSLVPFGYPWQIQVKRRAKMTPGVIAAGLEEARSMCGLDEFGACLHRSDYKPWTVTFAVCDLAWFIGAPWVGPMVSAAMDLEEWCEVLREVKSEQG